MRAFKQQLTRTAKPAIWTVETAGNAVKIRWGQEGGAVQETVQRFEGVNVGKANEKSPGQVAREFEDRQVLLKRREGYREIDPVCGEYLEEQAGSEIDWTADLPGNLRFYKPQHELSGHLERLVEDGSAWYTRKRNGEMAVIYKTAGGTVKIYSSKLLPHHKNEAGTYVWTDRLYHVMTAAHAIMPDRSILLGELVASQDRDDLMRVGSVMKSLTPRAIELQVQDPLWFCCWDVAFWEGHDTLQQPYRNRWDVVRSLKGVPYMTIPELFVGLTKDQALKMAIEQGWEGWVVIDPEAPYGDKAMSFHGKADRPKFCGKLKPKYTADFAVFWDPDRGVGTRGKGKKSVGVGAVVAMLWDPGSSAYVPVSKVGGGLSDENVLKFADTSLYPMVWEISFSSVTPAGSLQFPEFIRVREDKRPEECLQDQLPAADES